MKKDTSEALSEYSYILHNPSKPAITNLIWICESRRTECYSNGEKQVIRDLVKQNIRIFYLDPFETWFLQKLNKNLHKIPLFNNEHKTKERQFTPNVNEPSLTSFFLLVQRAISELNQTENLSDNSNKNKIDDKSDANYNLANGFFIYSRNRAAQVILRALNFIQFQQRNFELKNQLRLNGILLNTPILVSNLPQPGETIKFINIASKTKLPIYIFQAEYSTNFWHLPKTIKQLKSGGSLVEAKIYKGINRGFVVYDKIKLKDKKVRDNFYKDMISGMSRAFKMRQKMNSLAVTSIVQKKPERKETQAAPPTFTIFKVNNLINQGVELPNYKTGKIYSLFKDKSARMYIVNFWASWCPPCIEEIPSLNELSKMFTHKGLKVLAINIGEEKQVISSFLKKYPINATILSDRKGKALKDWKVYAYPSSFLLDSNYKIRYAVFGSIDWMLPVNQKIIANLLTESDKL